MAKGRWISVLSLCACFAQENLQEELESLLDRMAPLFHEAILWIRDRHVETPGAVDVVLDSKCLEEYWTNFPVLYRYSGAGAKLAWQRLRMDQVKTDTGGLEFDWHIKFRDARNHQEACTENGHRYFGVDISFNTEAVAADAQLSTLFTRFEEVGHTMRFAVGTCIPSGCGHRQLEQVLFFVFMAVTWNLSVDQVRRAVGKMSIEELSSWNDLCLDFVIAGFPKCATSTLSNNLHAHPKALIDGVSSAVHWREEDLFWRTGDWFLPPRSLVRDWNEASGDRCLQQRLGRAVGIKGPKYVYSELVMRALASMPAVRIVLIVRDPIDFLESAYHEEFFPADKNSEDTNWNVEELDDIPSLRDVALSDFPQMGSARGLPLHLAYTDPSSFVLVRRMGFFSEYIARARDLIPRERLMLLHMDSLTQDVSVVLNRVANFVGAGSFPEGSAFLKVVNRSPPEKRRENICVDMEVVEQLREFFGSEYGTLADTLARFNESIPPRLFLRQSRCDAEVPEPTGTRSRYRA